MKTCLFMPHFSSNTFPQIQENDKSQDMQIVQKSFFIDLAGSDPYNYSSLKAYFTREILYCDDHADRSEFIIEFLPEA